MRPLLAVVLALAFLAGCLAGPSSDDSRSAPVDVPEQAVETIPAQRAVAASTTWHEEPHRDAKGEAMALGDSLTIENKWEPRDVELTYHGVQPVFDEWGRPVPAHVFRYDVMELHITSVEFTQDFADVSITARYDPVPTEFAFDAATGRYLGATDLQHKMRGFSDARYPDPWVPSYMGDLLLPMAFGFLGGDIGKHVAGPVGDTWLNHTDVKPLEGDCTPYEYGFEAAPWYQAWMDRQGSDEEDDATKVLPEDEQHYVACLQAEGAPLYLYSGNQSDNLQLTRVGPAMATPGLAGTGLEPLSYTARDFEPMPLTLGLSKPVLVPPSASPGDWADIVRPVIAGVGTNLDYLQWQLQRDGLYVTDIDKAFPYFSAPLPLPPPLDDLPSPVPFETESWVFIADGEDAFWALVDSRYGGPEDPDLHVSKDGFALDDYPTALAPIVASGEVQAAWDPLLPPDPEFLIYSSFPDVLGDLPPEYKAILAPYLTTWSALEFCWQDKADGRFADFSALSGQMWAIGGETSTETSCSTGVDGGSGSDGFLRLPMGRQELWVRPAMGGAPGVLLVPGAGEAFTFGPGHPLDGAGLAQALDLA